MLSDYIGNSVECWNLAWRLLEQQDEGRAGAELTVPHLNIMIAALRNLPADADLPAKSALQDDVEQVRRRLHALTVLASSLRCSARITSSFHHEAGLPRPAPASVCTTLRASYSRYGAQKRRQLAACAHVGYNLVVGGADIGWLADGRILLQRQRPP